MIAAQNVRLPRVAIALATPNDVNAIARFMCGLSKNSEKVQRENTKLVSARAAARELGFAVGTMAVVAWDRDSARVIGHAVAMLEPFGAFEIALALAHGYEDLELAPLLLDKLMHHAKRQDVAFAHGYAFERKAPTLGIFAAAGYTLDRVNAS